MKNPEIQGSGNRRRLDKRTILAIVLLILLLFSLAFGGTVTYLMTGDIKNRGFITSGVAKVKLTDGTDDYGDAFVFFTRKERCVPGTSISGALRIDFTGTTIPVFIRVWVEATLDSGIPFNMAMNFADETEWSAPIVDENDRTYYLFNGGRAYMTTFDRQEVGVISNYGLAISPAETLESIGGKTASVSFSLEIIDAEAFGTYDEFGLKITNEEFSAAVDNN